MKKFIMLLGIGVMVIAVLAGCQKSAESLREAGMWKEREKAWQISDTGETAELRLWIDAKEEMTEEEQEDVIEYCVTNAKDSCPIEQDKFPCYVIFYKENTTEVLKQYKYADGEVQPISEADKSVFKLMGYQNGAMEEEGQ